MPLTICITNMMPLRLCKGKAVELQKTRTEERVMKLQKTTPAERAANNEKTMLIKRANTMIENQAERASQLERGIHNSEAGQSFSEIHDMLASQFCEVNQTR